MAFELTESQIFILADRCNISLRESQEEVLLEKKTYPFDQLSSNKCSLFTWDYKKQIIILFNSVVKINLF